MGLAGRKVKQRITADPRNLTWADDATRFGANYLAKLGWDSSQGLGVTGEGRTSHLKVTQKLDMLGIGAAQQRDPNGVAWKQNKDFESVLARLNATIEKKPCEDKEGEEKSAEPTEIGVEEQEDKKEEKEDRRKKKDKQKKRKAEDNDDEKTKKRKKSKEANEDKQEGTGDKQASPILDEPKKPYVPRVKAARNLASKNLANKSASAIAEILGVVVSTSTPITPSSGSTQTSGTLTPVTNSLEPLENLTISTKSVSDYFKERLAVKSSSSTPRPIPDGDDEVEAPRGGLGSSRLRLETTAGDANSSESMFSSLKTSSFLAATMKVGTQETTEASTEVSTEVDGVEKKNKKSKKEKKDQESDEPAVEERSGVSREEAKRLKALRKAEKARRKLEKEKKRLVAGES